MVVSSDALTRAKFWEEERRDFLTGSALGEGVFNAAVNLAVEIAVATPAEAVTWWVYIKRLLVAVETVLTAHKVIGAWPTIKIEVEP